MNTIFRTIKQNIDNTIAGSGEKSRHVLPQTNFPHALTINCYTYPWISTHGTWNSGEHVAVSSSSSSKLTSYLASGDIAW